jgi:exodeoxyribonuclease V alpha subunit
LAAEGSVEELLAIVKKIHPWSSLHYGLTASDVVRKLYFPDGRTVDYKRDDIPELDLAYAITIHKSQSSEFGAVIIPVLSQHFKMLFRNLIYTGLTRAKNLAVPVGTRKALAMAVKNQNTSRRQTFLARLCA